MELPLEMAQERLMALIKRLPLCFCIVAQLSINDPENVLMNGPGGKVMNPGGPATISYQEKCAVYGSPGE